MIIDEALKLYKRMRLRSYQSLFGKIRERDGSLSATEAFSVDAIYILGEPTIKQFSDFLGISQPNASYKISSLISKGYIEKQPSEDDRREHRLKVARKFYDYYEEEVSEVGEALKILGERHSRDELALFETMLREINSSL